MKINSFDSLSSSLTSGHKLNLAQVWIENIYLNIYQPETVKMFLNKVCKNSAPGWHFVVKTEDLLN